MHVCIFIKVDPMHTPPFTGVRIGSHLNRNAFMHGQITIGIHEEEVPKRVYTFFLCKPMTKLHLIYQSGILLE